MGTDLLERPDTRTEDTEEDRVAHIVLRLPGYSSAQAYITEAIVMGWEVEALCGYRWIPHRDPERLPVCQPCLQRYREIKGEI